MHTKYKHAYENETHVLFKWEKLIFRVEICIFVGSYWLSSRFSLFMFLPVISRSKEHGIENIKLHLCTAKKVQITTKRIVFVLFLLFFLISYFVGT